MDFITPLIKPAVDLLKKGLGAARRKLSKRKYEQLLSATITELLKEHPDLTAAEAQLAAAAATGADPDMHMLRAQGMLTSALQFHDRMPTRRVPAAKKKCAPSRAKKSGHKVRPRKQRSKI